MTDARYFYKNTKPNLEIKNFKLTLVAVVASPERVADALGCVEIVVTMARTVREAREHFVVDLRTVDSSPAGPAHTLALNATPVPTARGIQAIHCRGA